MRTPEIEPVFRQFTKRIVYPAAVALVFHALASFAAEPSADYFPAIKQELARLALSPVCIDSKSSCIMDGRLAGRNETVKLTVQYSRDTDTVYAYIDKFIEFPKGEKPSSEFALTLLTLNAELVTSKLEWDSAANAVRLSTVLSTDSNFDRRAFRSQLQGLLKVADKLRGSLPSGGDRPSK